MDILSLVCLHIYYYVWKTLNNFWVFWKAFDQIALVSDPWTKSEQDVHLVAKS